MLDIEQDAMCKPLLNKQETEENYDFASFCQLLVFWSNFHWRHPIESGYLLERGI